MSEDTKEIVAAIDRAAMTIAASILVAKMTPQNAEGMARELFEATR